MTHSFVGVVVEIDVRDFDVAGGQRFGIDTETVILGGDFHFLRKQILYRMIRTVMAELQFEGFSAQREAAELMSEANTEDRNAAEELLNILDGVADWLRVAGTIRKKNSVRLKVENVLGRRLRRNYPDVAVVINQKPQNILLDTEIVGRNPKFSRIRNSARLAHRFRPGRNRELDGAFFPAVGFFASDSAGEFLPSHCGQLLGFEDQLLGGRTVGSHNAAERPDVANVANERARVDIPDGGNFVAIQIQLRRFRCAPVRGDLRKLPHDERFDVRPRRFFVVEIGADVADMGIGQADDLPRVAWVREDFLITG